MAESPCAVVAIGGNALGGGSGPPSLAAQWDAARRTGEHLAALVVAEGCRLVVTHGNGPQVGDVLRRSEIAAGEVPPLTMDMAVAQTQGSIGYALAEALRQALEDRGDHRPVAAIVTETVVAGDDPAFRNPTKPVGPFLTADEAADRRRRHPGGVQP
ncbi:MAG: carbamate kinase, partial [Anaerolineae bacterium]